MSARTYEHYGSMNDRTTEVSIELRYLMLRHGRLLRTSGVLPSRPAMAALQVAARFLGLPSWRYAVAYGWLQDIQSTAIAMLEGPS